MARMVYSSPDMLALVAEINARRIPMVYGERLKRLGGMSMLGDKEKALLLNARRMHARYECGDFRHNEKEAGRIKELIDLLLAHHTANKGGKPGVVKWPADNAGWLVSKEPQPADMYQRCVHLVHTQW